MTMLGNHRKACGNGNMLLHQKSDRNSMEIRCHVSFMCHGMCHGQRVKGKLGSNTGIGDGCQSIFMGIDAPIGWIPADGGMSRNGHGLTLACIHLIHIHMYIDNDYIYIYIYI